MDLNKHILTFLTYCDTKEKVDILKDCILYFNREFPNLDILIYAHYQLPLEVQKMVKFYIYDSTNPLIDMSQKYTYSWYTVSHFLRYPSRALDIYVDSGWAVMSMWEKSIKYARTHDYIYAHTINYDLDVYDGRYKQLLLDNMEKLENGIEAIFPGSEDYMSIGYTALTHMSVNINSAVDKIWPNLSLQDYLSDRGDLIENYFAKVLRKINNINISYCKLFDINELCNRQVFYQNKELNHLFIWLGRENDRIILIVDDKNAVNISKLKIKFSEAYTYELQEPILEPFIVIDLTNQDLKYLKILQYNEIFVDYTAVSNIDKTYLDRHIIEPM